MKKAMLIAVAAMAASRLAAVPAGASGNYNTYGGYSAGAYSSSSRGVMVGAFAGYWAKGIYDAVYLGVASGYNTTNAQSCIGIGSAALKGARGCDGCIGIGQNALADAISCANCVVIGNPASFSLPPLDSKYDYVWINGQIEIGPSGILIRSSPYSDPEIALTNGVITLRGNVLDTPDITVGHADDASLAAEAMHALQADKINVVENPDLPAFDYAALSNMVVQITDATNRIARLEAALHALTNAPAAH